MPNFNRIILIGHCTKDPETKEVGASSVTSFGIAVNENYKSKDGEKQTKTLFVPCKAWGKTGALVQEYVARGDAIMVEGELRIDQFEQQGEKKSFTNINVRNVQFLGSRAKNDKGESAPRTKPWAKKKEQSEDAPAPGPQGDDASGEVPF